MNKRKCSSDITYMFDILSHTYPYHIQTEHAREALGNYFSKKEY